MIKAYFFHGIIICDVSRIFNAVNNVNIGILVRDVVEHARLLKIAVTFIRSMLALKRPAITILLLLRNIENKILIQKLFLIELFYTIIIFFIRKFLRVRFRMEQSQYLCIVQVFGKFHETLR